MATHSSTVNTSPAGVRLGGVQSSPTLYPGPRAQCFLSFLIPQEIPVRSASAFSEWQRGGDECHTVVPIPGGRDFYDTGYKSWSQGVINVSVPEVNMLKNSSTLAVSVPINLSIKFGFVSVNGPGETYLRNSSSSCHFPWKHRVFVKACHRSLFFAKFISFHLFPSCPKTDLFLHLWRPPRVHNIV